MACSFISVEPTRFFLELSLSMKSPSLLTRWNWALLCPLEDFQSVFMMVSEDRRLVYSPRTLVDQHWQFIEVLQDILKPRHHSFMTQNWASTRHPPSATWSRMVLQSSLPVRERFIQLTTRTMLATVSMVHLLWETSRSRSLLSEKTSFFTSCRLKRRQRRGEGSRVRRLLC